ncbi:hypothetical protein D777_01235 [Marinobacter nitratireducens]|uniref:Uncharacterized protein n=1 Tax=Marinobacter nitratireducens TaxID=1137280 RepID=A0A072N547_9GAMM|nr:hypothetical protein D777_01235 [Marinobacter nitratireducens]
MIRSPGCTGERPLQGMLVRRGRLQPGFGMPVEQKFGDFSHSVSHYLEL